MYFIDFNSEVPHIISGFTEAGARNDANLVYSYFFYDATAVQELTYFIKNQPELIAYYERVVTNYWEVVHGTNGTAGYVSDIIIYTDNKLSKFEAQLVQEDGSWNLLGIFFK